MIEIEIWNNKNINLLLCRFIINKILHALTFSIKTCLKVMLPKDPCFS